MARPDKVGLDYFSIPVNWLDGIEMRKLMRACGPSAPTVIIKVWGLAYANNGYFLKWDKDATFLVADDVNMKEQAVDEIVSKAVTIGLFDLGVYSGYSVLTSYDMQNQYSYAARKRNRHKIRPEYDLSGVSDVNNSVNVGDNPATGVVLDDQSTHMYMNKDMHINNRQTDIPAREDAESVDGSGPSKAMLQWQELWGWPNAIAQEDLRQWISDFGDDLVTWVIQYAARKDVQARSADKYLDRVFVAYKERGITTVEAAEAESTQHEEVAKANAPRPQRQYIRQKREEQTPKWAKEGYVAPKEVVTPEMQSTMDEQLAQIAARRKEVQEEGNKNG